MRELQTARKHAREVDAVANFKKPFNYDEPDQSNTGIAFLVVCDMLLTGFDAPIEQVMYIDKKGKFSVRAKFIEYREDTVRLKREDGKIVPVRMTKLSEEDQKYIRAQIKAKRSNTVNRNAFSARSGTEKPSLVRDLGGTEASEAAVARALEWFSHHQFPDGGWDFDFRASRCQGQCKNHGTMQARTGATAMALLPFLGAGHTHLKGKYKEQLKAGLNYLVQSIKPKDLHIGELWEANGTMYSHCLATMALCEAYGMTKDNDLKYPAQAAVNYVIVSQIRNDGGWRYRSNDSRGDTSVTGWAFLALKSADMANLQVDNSSYHGASLFLDSVQADEGAGYGYTTPGKGSSTTAIGLLCRMYLGWNRTHKPLQVGVKTLSEQGPSRENMYFNYYATQVMRHYGGESWTGWNQAMRDMLVETQAKEGHQNGSWIDSSHGAPVGGRIYSTSLATMILEVYYRHPPIYGPTLESIR